MPEEEILIEDDSSEDRSATIATDIEDDEALPETALEATAEPSEAMAAEEPAEREAGPAAEVPAEATGEVDGEMAAMEEEIEEGAALEVAPEAEMPAEVTSEADGEAAALEGEAEEPVDREAEPATEAPAEAPDEVDGEALALEEPAAAEAEPVAETPAETNGEAATPEEEGEEPEQEIPEDAAWYVVHTYSGYENKVKQNLEYRIKSLGMEDRIFRIVVPVEEEVDIKEGQRRVVERRIFPGYVFVQMKMDDEAWYLIHNTPGVTGFVGSGNRPTPLRDEEVERILKRIEAEKPTVRVSFREGQRVRIVDGPFSDFHGIVDEIDMERGKVRLLVSFFGRETPVELDLLQVEKG